MYKGLSFRQCLLLVFAPLASARAPVPTWAPLDPRRPLVHHGRLPSAGDPFRHRVFQRGRWGDEGERLGAAPFGFVVVGPHVSSRGAINLRRRQGGRSFASRCLAPCKLGDQWQTSAKLPFRVAPEARDAEPHSRVVRFPFAHAHPPHRHQTRGPRNDVTA